MSDTALNFGDGTWIEAKGTILTTLNAHELALKGNGKAGLEERMGDAETALAEMKAYGKASVFWGKVTAGLIGLLLTAIGILTTVVLSTHKG